MKQNAALALSNLLLFRGNKQENFHVCCSSFLCIDSYFHLDLLSSAWRTSFHISCSASFLMVNPFSFYTSEKFFISTFFLKVIFIRYRILSWCFFFSALERCWLISSCLHCFWWEICCHPYIFKFCMQFSSSGCS